MAASAGPDLNAVQPSMCPARLRDAFLGSETALEEIRKHFTDIGKEDQTDQAGKDMQQTVGKLHSRILASIWSEGTVGSAGLRHDLGALVVEQLGSTLPYNATGFQERTRKRSEILQQLFKRISLDSARSRFDTEAGTKQVAGAQAKIKTRADFPSDLEYGVYVKDTLKVGVSVRMLVEYGSIHKGDIGIFLQSNARLPPAQFQWRDHKHTYWVHWSQVEILDGGPRPEPRGLASAASARPQDAGSDLWQFGMRASMWVMFSYLRQTWERADSLNLQATSALIDEGLQMVRSLPGDTISSKCAGSSQWATMLHEISLRLLDVAQPGLSAPDSDRNAAVLLALEIGTRSNLLKTLLQASLMLLKMGLATTGDNDTAHISVTDAGGIFRRLAACCEDKSAGHLAGANEQELESIVVQAESPSGLDSTSCAVGILLFAAMLQPSRSASARAYTLGPIPIEGLESASPLQPNALPSVASPDSGRPAPSMWHQVAALSPVQIVSAPKAILVVTQSGKLFTLGSGRALGLGLGPNESVSTLTEVVFGEVGVEIAHVSACHHVLACTRDGTLYSWGDNARGCLGHGTDESLNCPKQVDGITDVVSTSCGEAHSAAITRATWAYQNSGGDHGSGNLFTWGRASLGRLGHGDRVDQSKPRLVVDLVNADLDVCAVACGYGDAHTLVLTRNGIVYSFGDADHGKLGRDSETADKPRPVKALEIHKIVKICAGNSFSLALSDAGVVYAFGSANRFVLGNGTDQGSEKTPVAVVLPEGLKVVDVAAGPHHVVAITDAADVYTWGSIAHGGLDEEAPIQVDESATVLTQVHKLDSVSGRGMSQVSAGPACSIVWSSCVLSQTGTTGHFNSDGSQEITDILKQSLADITDKDRPEHPRMFQALVASLDLLLSHITKLNRLQKDGSMVDDMHRSQFASLKPQLLQYSLAAATNCTISTHPGQWAVVTSLAREALFAGWDYFQLNKAEHASVRNAVVNDACSGDGRVTDGQLNAKRLLDRYWELLMPTMLERLDIVLDNFASVQNGDAWDSDGMYLTNLLLKSFLTTDACLPVIFGQPPASGSSRLGTMIDGNPFTASNTSALDAVVGNKATETRASLLRLMLMVVDNLASLCKTELGAPNAASCPARAHVECDAGHRMVTSDRPYPDTLWVCNRCRQVGQGYAWHCDSCSFDVCAQCVPLGHRYRTHWSAVVPPKSYQNLSDNEFANRKNLLVEKLKVSQCEGFAIDGTAAGSRAECVQLVNQANEVGLEAELRMQVSRATQTTYPHLVTAVEVLLRAQNALLASVAYCNRSSQNSVIDTLAEYASAVFRTSADLLVFTDGIAGDPFVQQAIIASPVGTVLPQLVVGLQYAVFNRGSVGDVDLASLTTSVEGLLFQLDAFNSQCSGCRMFDDKDLAMSEPHSALFGFRCIESATVESPHPYCACLDGINSPESVVRMSGASFLRIEFDAQCGIRSTGTEVLEVVRLSDNTVVGRHTGNQPSTFQWRSIIVPGCDAVMFRVVSDMHTLGNVHTPDAWGWRATVTGYTRNGIAALHCISEKTVECPHPYNNSTNEDISVSIPGSLFLQVTFDERCHTESDYDVLTISQPAKVTDAGAADKAVTIGKPFGTANLSGPPECWPATLTLYGDAVNFHFTSDSSGVAWGYKVTVRGYNVDEAEKDPSKLSLLALLDTERCLANFISRYSSAKTYGQELQRDNDDGALPGANALSQYTKVLSKGLVGMHVIHEESPDRDFLVALSRHPSEADTLDVTAFVHRMYKWAEQHRMLLNGSIHPAHPTARTLVRLVATLIHHDSSCQHAMKLMAEGSKKLVPKEIEDVWRTAFAAQKSIICAHGSEGISYSELCNGVNLRCTFLLSEVNPAFPGASTGTTNGGLSKWKEQSLEKLYGSPSRKRSSDSDRIAMLKSLEADPVRCQSMPSQPSPRAAASTGDGRREVSGMKFYSPRTRRRQHSTVAWDSLSRSFNTARRYKWLRMQMAKSNDSRTQELLHRDTVAFVLDDKVDLDWIRVAFHAKAEQGLQKRQGFVVFSKFLDLCAKRTSFLNVTKYSIILGWNQSQRASLFARRSEPSMNDRRSRRNDEDGSTMPLQLVDTDDIGLSPDRARALQESCIRVGQQFLQVLRQQVNEIQDAIARNESFVDVVRSKTYSVRMVLQILVALTADHNQLVIESLIDDSLLPLLHQITVLLPAGSTGVPPILVSTREASIRLRHVMVILVAMKCETLPHEVVENALAHLRTSISQSTGLDRDRFLRLLHTVAVTESMQIELSGDAWIDVFVEVVESGLPSSQILVLEAMRLILPAWNFDSSKPSFDGAAGVDLPDVHVSIETRMPLLIHRLLVLLAKRLRPCVPSMVAINGSTSKELVHLLRSLHSLGGSWGSEINRVLCQYFSGINATFDQMCDLGIEQQLYIPSAVENTYLLSGAASGLWSGLCTSWSTPESAFKNTVQFGLANQTLSIDEYGGVYNGCRDNQELCGRYDPLTTSMAWSMVYSFETVTRKIHFDGKLASLGETHLVVSGRWSHQSSQGSFLLAKSRNTGPSSLAPPCRPVVWHPSFKGHNVTFSDDGTVATRTDSYSEAIVLSDEPLALINGCKEYEIELKKHGDSSWSGSLACGVTVTPPSKIRSISGNARGIKHSWLLDGTCIYKDGVTITAHYGESCISDHGTGLESLSKGSKIRIRIERDGTMRFFFNGQDQGVAATGLPVDEDLWVLADVYGQAESIRIAGNVVAESMPSATTSSVQGVFSDIGSGEARGHVKEVLQSIGMGHSVVRKLFELYASPANAFEALVSGAFPLDTQDPVTDKPSPQDFAAQTGAGKLHPELTIAALALVGETDNSLRIGSVVKRIPVGRGTVTNVFADGCIAVAFSGGRREVLTTTEHRDLEHIPIRTFNAEAYTSIRSNLNPICDVLKLCLSEKTASSQLSLGQQQLLFFAIMAARQLVKAEFSHKPQLVPEEILARSLDLATLPSPVKSQFTRKAIEAGVQHAIRVGAVGASHKEQIYDGVYAGLAQAGLVFGEHFAGRFFSALARLAVEGGELNIDTLIHQFRRWQLHDGVRCDSCGAASIRGLRHRSNACTDFNLCNECYTGRTRHQGGFDTFLAPFDDAPRLSAPTKLGKAAFGVGVLVCRTWHSCNHSLSLEEPDLDVEAYNKIGTICRIVDGAEVEVDWGFCKRIYFIDRADSKVTLCELRLMNSAASAPDGVAVPSSDSLTSILSIVTSKLEAQPAPAANVSDAAHAHAEVSQQNAVIRICIDAEGINTKINGITVEGKLPSGEIVMNERAIDSLDTSSVSSGCNSADILRTYNPVKGECWESNGPSGSHWVQLNFSTNVAVSRVSLIAYTKDSYRPSKLTVMAGPDDSNLIVINENINCKEVRKEDGEIVVLDTTPQFNGATLAANRYFTRKSDRLGASLVGSAEGEGNPTEDSNDDLLCQKLSAMQSNALLLATSRLINSMQISLARELVSQSYALKGLHALHADNIMSLLNKQLRLFRFAVGGKLDKAATDSLGDAMRTIASEYPPACNVLIELCITELKRLALGAKTNTTSKLQQSVHPYLTNHVSSGEITIPGASVLEITFDKLSCTMKKEDVLTLTDINGEIVAILFERKGSCWAQSYFVEGHTVRWVFSTGDKKARSDREDKKETQSAQNWGWRCFVESRNSTQSSRLISEHALLLNCASFELVKPLLKLLIHPSINGEILRKVASALASCAALEAIDVAHRTWAIVTLRDLLAMPGVLRINVPLLMSKVRVKSASHDSENQSIVRGMRLEARDRKSQQICVATVKEVSGTKVTVAFDGRGASYEYVEDLSSDDLHPVGWCAVNGYPLTAPPRHFGEFTWESYLLEQRCRPVPAGLLTSPTNASFLSHANESTTLNIQGTAIRFGNESRGLRSPRPQDDFWEDSDSDGSTSIDDHSDDESLEEEDVTTDDGSVSDTGSWVDTVSTEDFSYASADESSCDDLDQLEFDQFDDNSEPTDDNACLPESNAATVKLSAAALELQLPVELDDEDDNSQGGESPRPVSPCFMQPDGITGVEYLHDCMQRNTALEMLQQLQAIPMRPRKRELRQFVEKDYAAFLDAQGVVEHRPVSIVAFRRLLGCLKLSIDAKLLADVTGMKSSKNGLTRRNILDYCLRCEQLAFPNRSVEHFQHSINDNYDLLQDEESKLETFLKSLPHLIMKQYDFEVPIIERGSQLCHSHFLKALLGLVLALGIDKLPCCVSQGCTLFVKNAEDFPSTSDYDKHLRSNLKTNMQVKCHKASDYVAVGEIGSFLRFSSEHKHKCEVFWMKQQKTHVFNITSLQILSDMELLLLKNRGHTVESLRSRVQPMTPVAEDQLVPTTKLQAFLMVDAIVNCDFDKVATFLELGTSPNILDDHGQNLLAYAAAYGTSAVVCCLCAAGADGLDDALLYAVLFDNLETATELLRRGADPKMTDVDGQSALGLAKVLGRMEFLRLLEDPHFSLRTQYASLSGDANLVRPTLYCRGNDEWSWLRKYRITLDCCSGFNGKFDAGCERQGFPREFLVRARQNPLVLSEERRRPMEMLSRKHEDNGLFSLAMDAELVHWLSSHPADIVPSMDVESETTKVKVLLAAADKHTRIDEVRKNLGHGFALTVSTCSIQELCISMLRKYDCTVIWSNVDSPDEYDRAKIGDALGDYIANGGKVVTCFHTAMPAGRWETLGCNIFEDASAVTAGVVPDGESVALAADVECSAGVSCLAGPMQVNIGTISTNPIMCWPNNQPALATKVIGDGRVVLLNMYPPSRYCVPESAQPPQVSAIFAALYDYEAQNDDQMSFMKGDQISAVFTSGQVDWYQATSVSDPSITGWVPSNYLVELKAAITSQAPPQRQVPIAPGAQPRGFDQRPGHLQQSEFHRSSDSSISTNSGTNSVNNSGVLSPSAEVLWDPGSFAGTRLLANSILLCCEQEQRVTGSVRPSELPPPIQPDAAVPYPEALSQHQLCLINGHEHPVADASCNFEAMAPYQAEWMCDLCDLEMTRETRFRCIQGCDFDVCTQCLTRAARSDLFSVESDAPVQPRADKIAVSVPVIYSSLTAMPVSVLRARWALLMSFAEHYLLPSIHMLDLVDSRPEGSFGLVDLLRNHVPSSPKELMYKKILRATMHRGADEHGEVITLNRIQPVKKKDGGESDATVFEQACAALEKSNPKYWLLPSRVWKVQFTGEGLDDVGGGYSESISEMCDELQSGKLNLLVDSPNGRDDVGINRDCFIFSPEANAPEDEEHFGFLGKIIGASIRTGEPIDLKLAPPMWKLLVGQSLAMGDIDEIDHDYIPGLEWWSGPNAPSDEESFAVFDFPCTTQSASGKPITVLPNQPRITKQNRDAFLDKALHMRLHEFDFAAHAVRRGMAAVVPVPILTLFTGPELQRMVCGDAQIDISVLKSVTTYADGLSESADLIGWFWDVLESMSPDQRSHFIRFTWGRTRLPRNKEAFKGANFQIQALEKYGLDKADLALPEAYTCFFLLKLPRYSSKEILREKLVYAINFCKSIDTDNYARTDLYHTSDGDSEDESETTMESESSF